jgi:hypothetical protein
LTEEPTTEPARTRNTKIDRTVNISTPFQTMEGVYQNHGEWQVSEKYYISTREVSVSKTDSVTSVPRYIDWYNLATDSTKKHIIRPEGRIKVYFIIKHPI